MEVKQKNNKNHWTKSKVDEGLKRINQEIYAFVDGEKKHHYYL